MERELPVAILDSTGIFKASQWLSISSLLIREVQTMSSQFRSPVAMSFLVATILMMGQAQTSQTAKDQVQGKQGDIQFPVATTWTLEAAAPVQQAEIKAVMLLICTSTKMKGSGFLVEQGFVVTNNHVVAGCTPQQMLGISSAGTTIQFGKVAVDADVDLALLKPSKPLTGGLRLATVDNPPVGTPVSTWGYPLQFNGPAPLLSNGYIAGFREDGVGAKKVKHLIVNGAINPGNSGGPLFVAGSDQVVGIVVAKFLPYSASVQQLISVMSNTTSGLIYTGTDGNGKPIQKSEAQIVASILQEFYDGTQVMIGEAISASELRALLAQKEAELRMP
jgi:S1-C subfamily serine protease